jgi:hypothetical protein
MDLIKKIKPFEVRVAKLFSKHFKVAQQRDMLQQNFHPIAVGTPNRLEKLLEVGALSLAHTDLVLLDMSQNQKKATILESNDVSMLHKMNTRFLSIVTLRALHPFLAGMQRFDELVPALPIPQCQKTFWQAKIGHGRAQLLALRLGSGSESRRESRHTGMGLLYLTVIFFILVSCKAPPGG